MEKHRAVIIGAGRIGAGWNWNDDKYTHSGAYRALSARVELIGFVEPDVERGEAAFKKWGVPWATSLNYFNDFDMVSVCVQPEQRAQVMASLPSSVKGAWVEKPWVSGEWAKFPVQVNYQRRADALHRKFAEAGRVEKLVVYGKDDETTRCHFRDLSRWWNVQLDYRAFNGPCAYIARSSGGHNCFFDNGGVDSGECFKLMLGNLMDAMELKADLWSPPYVE